MFSFVIVYLLIVLLLLFAVYLVSWHRYSVSIERLLNIRLSRLQSMKYELKNKISILEQKCKVDSIKYSEELKKADRKYKNTCEEIYDYLNMLDYIQEENLISAEENNID